MMRYKVLVIYDITDDKRRSKVNKVLETFGVRIQRSAFECYIDAYDYEKLVRKMENLHCDDDVMKIYRFTDAITEVSFGVFYEPPTEEFEII